MIKAGYEKYFEGLESHIQLRKKQAAELRKRRSKRPAETLTEYKDRLRKILNDGRKAR